MSFRYESTVQSTPDEHTRRIDVNVYKDGDRRNTSYAALTSFLSDVGRQP